MSPACRWLVSGHGRKRTILQIRSVSNILHVTEFTLTISVQCSVLRYFRSCLFMALHFVSRHIY